MKKSDLSLAVFFLSVACAPNIAQAASDACYNYTDHIRCERNVDAQQAQTLGGLLPSGSLTLGKIKNISQSTVHLTMYNGNPSCIEGPSASAISLQPGDVYSATIYPISGGLYRAGMPDPMVCDKSNDTWEWKCQDDRGSTVCNALTYIFK